MTTETKRGKVLVIGTNHNIQRHQDKVSKLESDRAEFEKFLRQLIEKGKTDLVAEEAGDDEKVWENLKLYDVFADSAEGKTVDNPASPIAKIIAGENGVRWEDI